MGHSEELGYFRAKHEYSPFYPEQSLSPERIVLQYFDLRKCLGTKDCTEFGVSPMALLGIHHWSPNEYVVDFGTNTYSQNEGFYENGTRYEYWKD